MKGNPEDVIQILSENSNSLEVLATGESRGRKLTQMRYLLNKWNVDMASFVEIQVDLRHADEGHQIDNLFVRGYDRHSAAAYKSTVKRILSPRKQRGGIAAMAFGRVVASIHIIDRDETKLGRFCCTKLGSSGKTTYMMTMYPL